MEKATGLTAQKELLKWLTHTILIAGLVAFSGQVSEFRILGSQPAKTELNEERFVRYKKTVSLKAFLHSLSTQSSCTVHFIFSLIEQHKKITVQFKNNIEKFTTKQSQGFLIYHALNYSKEHDSSQLMG